MKKYYVKYWDRTKLTYQVTTFYGKDTLITWLNFTYPNGLADKKNRFGVPVIVYGAKIEPFQVPDRVRYDIRS